jgi:hypothetical protein
MKVINPESRLIPFAKGPVEWQTGFWQIQIIRLIA